LIPDDFEAWSKVELRTRRVGAADLFTLTLWKGGVADAAVNAVSIMPDVDGEVQTFSFVPSGSYAPGDSCLLEIHSVVDSAEEANYVGPVLRYKSRGGGHVQNNRPGEENLAFPGAGTKSRVYDTTARHVYTQHLGTGANQLMTFYDYVRLPPDLRAWSAVKIHTYRSGAVDILTATIWRGGTVDPAVDGVSVSPASAGAWEQFTLSPSLSYAPDDNVLFRLSSQVDNTLLTRHRDLLWEWRT
jgi:hypothetical protein